MQAEQNFLGVLLSPVLSRAKENVAYDCCVKNEYRGLFWEQKHTKLYSMPDFLVNLIKYQQ